MECAGSGLFREPAIEDRCRCEQRRDVVTGAFEMMKVLDPFSRITAHGRDGFDAHVLHDRACDDAKALDQFDAIWSYGRPHARNGAHAT